MRPVLSLAFLFVAALLQAQAPPFTQQKFDTEGDNGFNVFATGVNDSDLAVGYWNYGPQQPDGSYPERGFVWNQSFGLKLMPKLNGSSGYTFTIANAISNASPALIVGQAANAYGNRKAFYCTVGSDGSLPGSLTQLPSDGSTHVYASCATAVNKNGGIVGFAATSSAGTVNDPVRWVAPYSMNSM